MNLRDLEAEFLKYTPDPEDGREVYTVVESLDDADGITFACPQCFKKNGGLVGTHHVTCWFRGKVPDSVTPGPGRWTPQGTGLDDLTFVPGVPEMAVSILISNPGCGWHGFIRNGDAE